MKIINLSEGNSLPVSYTHLKAVKQLSGKRLFVVDTFCGAKLLP